MAKKSSQSAENLEAVGVLSEKRSQKKLGISYYDKNIISRIAEKSGLSPEYIQESAELSPKKVCLRMHLPDVILQENQWRIWCMRHRERLF